MVIRWNYLATLVVVVSFTVVHGEQLSSTDIKVDTANNRFEDLCPCLPVDICPRAYGSKPDDAKYLGNIMKCEDDKTVRCCGASATFVIGKSKPIPATQSDILTGTAADNVEENEIPDIGRESVKTLSARNDTTDDLSLEETGNIANFHIKEHLDGETDEEAAESESVIKTANEVSIKDGPFEPEAIPFDAPKSHRMPKNLDDVMTVYPNIMSGIPKTTPKNLPQTNEMKLFDEEIGMDLHLVFSQTTLIPEPTEEVTPSSTVEPTSKQPLNRFAKRGRQFRPAQKATTTQSSVTDLASKQTAVRCLTRQRINLKKSVSRPSSQESTNSTTRRPRVTLATTESSVDDLESKQTTVRSHPRRRIKLKNSISRPSSQESSNSTTRRPVNLATTTLTTTAPTTQENEILITSEDDKSQSSRFRLFNARRFNYLRRNATATSTTESSIEPTTRQTTQSKPLNRKRPSIVSERSSGIRNTSRKSKMDENLIRVMNSNHQNMISMVRVALKAATSGNIATEIPRSFASVDIGERVKKIEGILVEQMVNVYAEKLAELRSNRTEIDGNIVRSTEAETSKQTNSTRPFRGNKKFQMSDLLDKTPVVTMSPDEFRRTMRVRRPIVRSEEQVAVNIVPTTRRPHRRPTTEYQEALNTNMRVTSSSENNEQGSVRRRIKLRRRYKVEPSTFSTPIQLTYSTIATTFPTTLSIKTTSPTTEATTSTDEIDPTTEVSKVIVQEELPDIIENDTEDDTRDEKIDVTQDEIQEEPKPTVDESIQNIDINEKVSSKNPSSNSDVLSDFKPSPLWSISSDEKYDFNIKAENHSYVMNMDERERAFRKKNRHSRNAFDPPVQYLNGFVPAGPFKITGPIPKSSKLGDDAIIRYNLPRDTKANFSKN